MGLNIVNETEYGLYVWELPNGNYLSDGEGRLLNIPARKGDIKRLARICEVARGLGFGDGSPTFIPDVRRVTDAEHDDQVERLMAGETPDQWDVGVARDEARNRRNQH